MVACRYGISLLVFNFISHSLNTSISTRAHVLSCTFHLWDHSDLNTRYISQHVTVCMRSIMPWQQPNITGPRPFSPDRVQTTSKFTWVIWSLYHMVGWNKSVIRIKSRWDSVQKLNAVLYLLSCRRLNLDGLPFLRGLINRRGSIFGRRGWNLYNTCTISWHWSKWLQSLSRKARKHFTDRVPETNRGARLQPEANEVDIWYHASRRSEQLLQKRSWKRDILSSMFVFLPWPLGWTTEDKILLLDESHTGRNSQAFGEVWWLSWREERRQAGKKYWNAFLDNKQIRAIRYAQIQSPARHYRRYYRIIHFHWWLWIYVSGILFQSTADPRAWLSAQRRPSPLSRHRGHAGTQRRFGLFWSAVPRLNAEICHPNWEHAWKVQLCWCCGLFPPLRWCRFTQSV